MILEPQISLKNLATFCRRLAISTDAGIDERKIWEKESENGSPSQRRQMARVREGIDRGDSIHEAIARTENFFPPLFRELVTVGEETGSLTGVYRRLADHYDHAVSLRRTFLTSIAWPLIELAMALGVIGLLILVRGFLGSSTNADAPDIIGAMTFGLSGMSGLIIYFLIIGSIAAGITFLVLAIQRGKLWTRPIQSLVMRLPAVGGCLQTIALARMSWVMYLTLNVAFDVRRAMRLALESTGTDYYRRHTDDVETSLNDGEPIYKALAKTGAFPDDFIMALEVGETGGKTSEQMERMSLQYEERAQAALKTLSIVAGFAVAAMVGILIIVMIFRGMSAYVNMILDAAKPM